MIRNEKDERDEMSRFIPDIGDERDERPIGLVPRPVPRPSLSEGGFVPAETSESDGFGRFGRCRMKHGKGEGKGQHPHHRARVTPRGVSHG